jgi:uncharacterized protein (TIGR03435 family)
LKKRLRPVTDAIVFKTTFNLRRRTLEPILEGMCTLRIMLRFSSQLLPVFAFLSSIAFAQPAATAGTFEVVSVRPSQRAAGPDYNNQIAYTPAGFTARNVTLKRLVAEAWRLQMSQVMGPAWLDQNEYEIEARVPEGATREEVALMLKRLLADRFGLKLHSENRPMRAYALVVAQGGPKIRPVDPAATVAPHSGSHFRGDMRQFADLLTVQFSIPASNDPTVPAIGLGPKIPVLNETGLQGIFDFSVDIKPELNTDGFTAWSRVLEDQLGLKIESRKGDVAVVVVDEAERIPTAN